MRRFLVILLGLLIATGCTAGPEDPVAVLAEHAHPVSDVASFGDVVADALVVGVGEATHNTRDFFELKHRLFRYLVEEKGFTTFSLEVSWDIGLQLDDYVVNGIGDPNEILSQDPTWHTQEYLDLARWMRKHNEKNANDVRFAGNDILYPALTGAPLERVGDYLRQQEPMLLAEFDTLHAKLRDIGTVDALQGLPLAERAAIADQATVIARQLREQPDTDPWIVQHAQVIEQTARTFAFDIDGAEQHPEKVAPMMQHRDQAMADNTVWWQRHVGGKMLVSAHNGHITYESGIPQQYPKVQGAFLRDQLGTRYVSIGLTLGQGAFNAQDTADPDGTWRPFTVGPAQPGSNEYTLNQLNDQDYLLDLRTVPAAARGWLQEKRPTYDIGGAYPKRSLSEISLSRSFDVLIHSHRVEAAARLL